jgi:hypothetical protein
MQTGDRVAWADDGDSDTDDLAMRGTVREPTAEELAYVATWTSSARAAIQGYVIVSWDEEEAWESAWTDPADLRIVETP